ncbi:unnamed protein product [Adineta ricciae]|uniref:Uncharacterized protein n=1 Tax=Adineta ricciae TaxID=249248 RepID=A0A814LRU0_ADIRI|nr:unnamed protein product [Adineta ricciae]CAF1068793.1 unnamed protein product [Adineta ricciae]
MQQTITITSLFNTNEHPIQFNFSSRLRLTRHLVHITIFIVFISILAFIGHWRLSARKCNQSLSYFSRFIISIGIVSLVLNDLLIVNGITHPPWCYIHQIILHCLLTIIVTGHLLPDFYSYYTSRFSQQRDSDKLKSAVIFMFMLFLITQLILMIQWSDLWDKNSLDRPILCLGNVRPQLLILLLHILDFISIIQTIRSSSFTNEINLIHEKLLELNSILLRICYFFGTSVLQIFFLPGEFSGTLYSAILVIEYTLKYFVRTLYHSNEKYEINMIGLDNNDIPYLRLQSEDVGDDTRLLNDIN